MNKKKTMTVAWRCALCNKSGELQMSPRSRSLTALNRLFEAHQKASPACRPDSITADEKGWVLKCGMTYRATFRYPKPRHGVTALARVPSPIEVEVYALSPHKWGAREFTTRARFRSIREDHPFKAQQSVAGLFEVWVTPWQAYNDHGRPVSPMEAQADLDSYTGGRWNPGSTGGVIPCYNYCAQNELAARSDRQEWE